MSTPKAFVRDFYGPSIVSMFLLFLVIFSPKFVSVPSNVSVSPTISVVGIQIPLTVWLKNIWLIRGVILLAAMAGFIKTLSVDFSKYFPDTFRMDVYFDTAGLDRNLALHSANELKALRLTSDWKDHIPKYDDEVIHNLDHLWHRSSTGSIRDVFKRERLHASGTTTFKVKKIGLLSYKIVDSQGALEYELDIDKKPPRRFAGVFELRNTAENYIRPKIRDLMRSPCIALKPEFKQIFAFETGRCNAPIDHIVIGLTRVTLFPFPIFSDTIYLWKQSDGKAVPVAYCIYHEDTC